MSKPMQTSERKKILIAGLFLYGSSVLINYLVKIIPSLHFAKDAGISNVAVFHCIASYLFFIFLQRSAITFLGLGLLVGLATCVVEIFLMNIITWNPLDYYNFVLLNQFIADSIIFVTGICYLLLSRIM